MSTIDSRDDVLKRQKAAEKAHDKMLQALLGYSPCGKLTVDDVKYFAELARTFAFDAIEEAFPR